MRCSRFSESGAVRLSGSFLLSTVYAVNLIDEKAIVFNYDVADVLKPGQCMLAVYSSQPQQHLTAVSLSEIRDLWLAFAASVAENRFFGRLLQMTRLSKDMWELQPIRFVAGEAEPACVVEKSRLFKADLFTDYKDLNDDVARSRPSLARIAEKQHAALRARLLAKGDTYENLIDTNPYFQALSQPLPPTNFLARIQKNKNKTTAFIKNRQDDKTTNGRNSSLIAGQGVVAKKTNVRSQLDKILVEGTTDRKRVVKKTISGEPRAPPVPARPQPSPILTTTAPAVTPTVEPIEATPAAPPASPQLPDKNPFIYPNGASGEAWSYNSDDSQGYGGYSFW